MRAPEESLPGSLTAGFMVKALNRKFGYLVLIAILTMVLVVLVAFAINVLAELIFAPLLEFVLRLFTSVGR